MSRQIKNDYKSVIFIMLPASQQELVAKLKVSPAAIHYHIKGMLRLGQIHISEYKLSGKGGPPVGIYSRGEAPENFHLNKPPRNITNEVRQSWIRNTVAVPHDGKIKRCPLTVGLFGEHLKSIEQSDER